MKKVLYILIPVVLIALMIFKLKSNKETAENRIYHYDKEQAVNVQADTLTLEAIDAEYSFTGTFQPNKESKISAEVQGKINSILVEEGSPVRKGQALIKLDDALLQQQLNTINVQIQNIKSEFDIQLQNNQLQIDGFQADVNRYRVLAAADAIQGVQLEKAELQLNTAQIQRKTILQQSALKNAEAQKANIEEQIKKTVISAPFSGIVTAKLTEVGAFAAPGMPLLQITDIAQLKFIVTVSEIDLNLFEKNQSYNVIADVYPEIIHFSKVTMIGVKGNIANSFPIQFSVKNTADLKIKSGMFGVVIIKEGKERKQIIIPASAIVGSGIQPQVYLAKNGKAVLQDIVISKRIQNKVVVESGLREGDVMITGGFINLFEGANVATI